MKILQILLLLSLFISGCKLDEVPTNFDEPTPQISVYINGNLYAESTIQKPGTIVITDVPKAFGVADLNSTLQMNSVVSGTNQTELLYSTNHPEAVSIDSNGLVKFISTGNYTIEFSVKLKSYPEVVASFAIVVYIKEENNISVTASSPKSAIEIGEFIQLSWAVHNSANQTVKFTSLNKTIATVNELGLVKGIGEGNVNIIVTSLADTNKSATVNLTVNVFDPIPSEVAVKKGQITNALPPSGFSAGLSWGQVIHDVRLDGTSKVEIDYMRFYGLVNGVKMLLSSDEYDDGEVSGAHYSRTPYWFGTQTKNSLSHQFENGNLVLIPSDFPADVLHWWNHAWPRATVPTGTTKTWVEIRFRITGHALLQIGADYWRTPTALYGDGSNNKEAYASDWYFESADWQVVSWPK